MNPNDDIRIAINADYADTPQAQLARRLPQEGLPADAIEIYRARNIVVITSDNSLCIKSYGVPGMIKGIIYGFFRYPKARRAWNNAFVLASLGIATPKPVAVVECRRFGMLKESFYLTEVLDGWSTLRAIEGRNDFNSLARALAQFIIRLHKAKVFMKDLTPGNVLFRRLPDGSYDFALVDINRMEFDITDRNKLMSNFRSPLDTRQGVETLARHYAALLHPSDPQSAERTVGQALHIYDRQSSRRRAKIKLKRLFGRKH